ncbi:Acetyl xylan esterase (AXE1) [Halogranum amylolyticum]|uniref:Acetyl xylan esterase (AXE1) n=1 Tax=Halogranum amylolyticum TaxID=660520 RepID=A0A1H8UHY0_9EURY|nr:prolyl oligopeptidase family serine peptidase [Halogranum amylolyticum]SEP02829.1 Acetyl xylan esterase (AXE1) [Halogranum amylolyticum]
MESFEKNVDGYYDVGAQLPRYLYQRANEQFKTAERERKELDSISAVADRTTTAREFFIDSIGGLPNEKTPLEPEVTGTLERDDYIIEKVVFQSLPGFHVTTNLYLPKEKVVDNGFPGVLFFCGHASVGKAATVYQQACIELVSQGFAVLAVDPIGQGERHQFYDPETGQNPRENTIEHSYLGHQCQLIGTNLARYFVWDCIRAFDYLASRPEVDQSRIGAMGNSGGGMQTGYLMLADDRLAAAVPCCFITSKEDYMKTGQAQDGEQILWRAIERGPRYDDFLTGFAPKPVQIGAAQSDFLCIEGAYRTVARAESVYGQYDAVDNIDLVISPETHGLSPTLRQAAINWFRSHLQGRAPDFKTGDPHVESTEILHCLPNGEVNAAYADERHVVDLNRAYLEKASFDTNRTHDDAEPLAHRLRERFDLNRARPRLFPRSIQSEAVDGLVTEKVFFHSDSDIVTTGILIRDSDVDTPIPTVTLLPQGTADIEDYEDSVKQWAHERGVVLIFDPRGIGGVRAREVNTPLANGGEYFDYHGTEYKLASDALMTGTSLLALRTFDVLRAIDYFRHRTGGEQFGIVGAGDRSFSALYAAVADSGVASVTVEDVLSFQDRATTKEITPNFGLTVFDVVGKFDVPQLLTALDDRTVRRISFPKSSLPNP